MLSTVLSIGGIVAIIGGVAYLAFQYLPYFIEVWDDTVILYESLCTLFPDWLLPVIPLGLLCATCGLIIKII